MKDFSNHIINHNASALEAMEVINSLVYSLTLFVCDDNGKLIGTLTDGDIRRGLLKGNNVTQSVTDYMSVKFHFIRQNGSHVEQIMSLRKKGIELVPVLDDLNTIVRIYDLKYRKSVLPLECVIMAGGRGERLKPLTDTIPKPMLELGGKPIIEHNIDRLIQYGIEKIYISINYLGEQICNYFGDGSTKGISIEYIQEDIPLGTAGALSMINSFDTEYILLMNSDLFTNVNFEELYIETLNSNAEMGISSIPYIVNIPYAIFEREDNVIKSFKEKPNHTHYANAGIYLFKNKWVESIPKNTFYNMTDLISEILKLEKKIIHEPIVGYWIDIGKPDDYIRAKEIADHIK